MVTLMWASLDMVTLDSLQVFKDQSLIQIWTASLFTLYHAASLIVLLNMLIAMMSNSYQRVEVRKNDQREILNTLCKSTVSRCKCREGAVDSSLVLPPPDNGRERNVVSSKYIGYPKRC